MNDSENLDQLCAVRPQSQPSEDVDVSVAIYGDPGKMAQAASEKVEPARGNIVLAVTGGLVAAIAGAIIWAVITVTTMYQIGWMAVGVGFIVGMAVRLCGRGSSSIYGQVGAVFALAGCIAGNILTACAITAQQESVSIFEVIKILDFEIIVDTLTGNFQVMDVVFYGIAIYEGYKFSINKVDAK